METTLAVAGFVAFLLEAIVIIFANIISLVIFVKKFRHLKTYILLINLSFADLMVGFSTFRISVNYLIAATSSIWRQDQICLDVLSTFGKGFSDFVTLESFATLALIAVERAFSVIKPLVHRVCETKYYHRGLVLTWGTNTVPVVCFTVFRCNSELRELANFILLNGFGSVYFLVMILSYITICVNQRFYPVFQHNASTQMQVRLCKTLSLATLASAIAYMPYSILSVYNRILIASNSSKTDWNIYTMIATLLLCSNSFVNCLVYAWKMPAFRNELKNMFKRVLCKLPVNKRKGKGLCVIPVPRNRIQTTSCNGCTISKRKCTTMYI